MEWTEPAVLEDYGPRRVAQGRSTGRATDESPSRLAPTQFSAPGFERALGLALAETNEAVVVDLTNCDFLDSGALAVIVRRHKLLDRTGGSLRVCRPGPPSCAPLCLHTLYSDLEVYATRREALMCSQVPSVPGEEAPVVNDQKRPCGDETVASIRSSYTQMLWMGVRKRAAYFPVDQDRCRSCRRGGQAMDDVRRIDGGRGDAAAASGTHTRGSNGGRDPSKPRRQLGRPSGQRPNRHRRPLLRCYMTARSRICPISLSALRRASERAMNQFSTVTEQLSDGAHVVSVEGEIDMVTAPQFEAELLRAVEAARHPVVVDLTECDFLDSTALAVLIEEASDLTEAAHSHSSFLAPTCGRVSESPTSTASLRFIPPEPKPSPPPKQTPLRARLIPTPDQKRLLARFSGSSAIEPRAPRAQRLSPPPSAPESFLT